MSEDTQDPPHTPANDTDAPPSTPAPIIPRGLAQQHMSAALNRLVDALVHAEQVAMAIAAGLDATATRGEP